MSILKRVKTYAAAGLAAATIALSPTVKAEEAAPPSTISAEGMVTHDLSSDFRAEYTGSGLEAALEQFSSICVSLEEK